MKTVLLATNTLGILFIMFVISALDYSVPNDRITFWFLASIIALLLCNILYLGFH